MDHKETSKKKANLLKSIMANPKMAKMYRDGVSAPLGSTKRAQAQKVFSIMHKIHGLNRDGMGGPVSPMMPMQTVAPSTPKTPNYGNMVIFPAAPKFKNRPMPVQQNQYGRGGIKNDGKGGAFDALFAPQNFNVPTLSQTTNSTPKITGDMVYGDMVNMGNKVIDWFTPKTSTTTKPTTDYKTAIGNMFSGYDPMKSFGSLSFGQPNYNFNLPSLTSTKTTTPNMTMMPTSGTQSQTPAPAASSTDIQALLAKYKDPYAFLNQYTSGSTIGGETATQPQTSGTGPSSSSTSSTEITAPSTNAYLPSTYTQPKTGNATIQAAQDAVNQGMGPGFFALGATDKLFGGGLDDYLKNKEAELRKTFKIDELESELGQLTSMKGNLVPTLQAYIRGKDQYLETIDDLITKHQSTLSTLDMGNPAVANEYNKQLAYLQTLKGRQTARYGDYLSAAKADYEADVTAMQTKYETVYKNYSDALNREGTLSQNKYNLLYQAMTDLYNTVDQAPLKAANLEALRQQNIANALINAKNAAAASGVGSSADPDFLKKVKEYSDYISDDKGVLSVEKLGAAGLPGFFSTIAANGGNMDAAIAAVQRTMAASLTSTDNASGVVGSMSEYNKLLNNLAAVEGGADYARKIAPSVYKTANSGLVSYVESNIDQIKSATKDLLQGSSGWFSSTPSGLENKDAWIKRHSGSVNTGMLNKLYDVASLYKTATGKADTMLNDLFAGDNATVAQRVVNTLYPTQ